MELTNYSSQMASVGNTMPYSVVQAVVADTLFAAHRSIACLLMLAGSLLEDRSDLKYVNNRFPLEELRKVEKPVTENKDASDSENDDEEDDDDTAEQDDDDDAGDEDFSGEEGGDDDDDDEEGDTEEAPAANGNGGSDDEEDDDEEGDEDEDGEDDEEDEDEDEDEDQPPAKKRK